MGNIESIKQKINRLDGGPFQNLCNSYLYKSGYQNINSLGSQAGTQKTTKGTPDTFFTTGDGKYVFVEYTTQPKNLFKKMKSDIDKCLDTSKTKIEIEQIVEIIYCHTSSNITPSEDRELRILCENKGIKLTLIGIDKLAEDLYLFHSFIVKDQLGISLNTGQIQTSEEFIENYNANKLAAPIDTDFLFRTKELEDIDGAFNSSDIVILSGPAGAGKTKLAFEYAQNYSKKHGYKLYCIRSNAQPIFEDLKYYINAPGNYFLFVDDGNNLSNLQYVGDCATYQSKGINVKILITVRDYAFKKVKEEIGKASVFETINIKTFSDDEIKSLLEKAMDIKSFFYLNRIAKIAKGNARIAILAGKLDCNTNRLAYINDATQLYDNYFGSFLNETNFLDDNNLMVSAGIVAFLEAVHLDKIDDFEPILSEKNMTRSIFVESVHKLHELEILDLRHEKAVRFSDQCLSNYILKYIFIDKKLLKLSTMIQVLFPQYKEKVIAAINMLLSVFMNSELHDFVKAEIIELWDKLSLDNSPIFFDFVRSFFRVNPTKTFIVLEEKIEKQENTVFDLENIDFKKEQNRLHEANDIIEILGGFAESEDHGIALDLLLKYFIKCPDLYNKFYITSTKNFGITINSRNLKYRYQLALLKKMKEYAENNTHEAIVFLFLAIAEDFLKLHFSPTEPTEKRGITVYQIYLDESEGVKEYRSFIWNWLFELCANPKYKEKIRQLLYSYKGYAHENSASIVEFDLFYIQSLMQTYFSSNELKNCLLANHLVNVFVRRNKFPESLFDNYFSGTQFRTYSLLAGDEKAKDTSYIDYETNKEKEIKDYVLKCDFLMFKNIVDVCSLIQETKTDTIWQVSNGLRIAFDVTSQKHDYYASAIEYYINCGTPLNLNPCDLLQPLFSLMPADEIFKLITTHEYSEKNTWIYCYYKELPKEMIMQKHLENLYSFLSQTSDKDIASTIPRNVMFLDNYKTIDKHSFIKGCEIILNKREYSPFIVYIYFGSLFREHLDKPKQLIQKFVDRPDLLAEIYITCFLSRYYDFKGVFLKEIYSVYPPILDSYIEILVDESERIQERNVMCNCFFELPDFKAIYSKIIKQLSDRCYLPSIEVPIFIEKILISNNDDKILLLKQDELIRHCIQVFSHDEEVLEHIFNVLLKLKSKRKKEYFLLFINCNSSFESFRKIPLTPISYDWTGSAVPLHSAWIEFLQDLLSIFNGLKWIHHKNLVEEKITFLKNKIRITEIDEIFRE